MPFPGETENIINRDGSGGGTDFTNCEKRPGEIQPGVKAESTLQLSQETVDWMIRWVLPGGTRGFE